MDGLIAALAAFLLTHLIPAFPPVRAHLVRAMGAGVYLVFHSAVSLGVVVWLVAAFADAPYRELWPPSPAAQWVPVVAMPAACVLLVCAFSSANPLSLSFGKGNYDPARPGIVSITRHPLLWGLALWAGAHIPPNGDVAAVLIFGVFLGLSVLGTLGLDAKARGRLGAEEWARLAGPTASLPFAAAIAGRAPIDWRGIGWGRVVAGLILYGALLFGHPYLIGVTPLP